MEWLVAALSVETVQQWITAGGYIVLFGLLFACGLGMPMPEDIPLLIAGWLVAEGKMHLAVAGVCAWCGIIGGDCVLYYLGHKYGLHITRVPFIGKHVTRHRIEKAERLFEKYGIWVVAVGRLFAGIRGAMVVAAGTIRYSFVKFVVADGLAALVSGGLFVALGYFVRRKLGSIQEIRARIQNVEHWVMVGAIVLAVLIAALVIWRRRRLKRERIEEAMEQEVQQPTTAPAHLPSIEPAQE